MVATFSINRGWRDGTKCLSEKKNICGFYYIDVLFIVGKDERESSDPVCYYGIICFCFKSNGEKMYTQSQEPEDEK